MPEYRVYRITHGNAVAGPPTILECTSDRAAVIEAKKLLNGLDLEVWEGSRVVSRLKSKDAA